MVNLISLFIGFLAYAGEVAVIANPSVTVHALTQEELKSIYMLKKTSWEDGTKIVLCALRPGTNSADVAPQELLKKTASETKRFWLAELFKGNTTASPKFVDSLRELVNYIENTPGSIAVVPGSEKLSGAKIKTIALK